MIIIPGVSLILPAFDNLHLLTGTRLHKYDANKKTQLNEIFFSGYPYVIGCNNMNDDNPYYNYPHHINPIFNKAATLAFKSKSLVKYGTLDCSYILPSSNKTIKNHFNITSNVFIISNGNKPYSINHSMYNNTEKKRIL